MDLAPSLPLAGLALDLFEEFAAILLLSAIGGTVAVLLRQPLIVAFIFVGILAGPVGFDLVTEDEIWDLLAKAGIAVLLFVVGLKLDLTAVRRTGAVALAAGIGQIVFTSGIGFLICLALGLSAVHALYVAVALTFSSTIIIVKLLSDKREIDSLHGRIAVGLLIVQDIAVILVMIGLSAFGDTGETHVVEQGLVSLFSGVGLLAAVGLFMRFILPPVLRVIARSSELLVLAGIAWAASLAAVSAELGFSEEVGAFLAGVAIASTPFREAISSRLVSLRDFLLLFFFITLGAGLDFQEVTSQVSAALVLSAFVLIGNPLIVMAIMGFLGYRRRTGFLTGLTVAQISEFSLILGALGVSLGHLSDERLGLITLVGLITIGISSYLILYSHEIYPRLADRLKVFERRIPYAEDEADAEAGLDVDVIVFGLGRFGANIMRELEERGLRVLGVDFDPQAVAHVRSRGGAAHYGDAEDPEFYTHLPLSRARCVVGTMPEVTSSITLLRGLEHHAYRGTTAIAARSEADAGVLRAYGPDIVLMPFVDAATDAANVLAERLAAEAPR